MKTLIRFCGIAIILALMLCAVGCKKEPSAAVTTQATQAATQVSEETAPAEEVTAATDTTETSAPAATEQPAGTTEQPATEQPATPEDFVETDQMVIPEEDLHPEEQFGTGPLIMVKWETYEAMSEEAKTAYRACFSNDEAFKEWSDMAFMSYEIQEESIEFVDYNSLDLKMIIEQLTGETFE